MSEIERLLKQDNREKSKAGNGFHHLSGRGRGVVRMPSTYGQARPDYEKLSGPVITYNIKDTPKK